MAGAWLTIGVANSLITPPMSHDSSRIPDSSGTNGHTDMDDMFKAETGLDGDDDDDDGDGEQPENVRSLPKLIIYRQRSDPELEAVETDGCSWRLHVCGQGRRVGQAEDQDRVHHG